MTTPKETIWALDQHTKAKHEILRRYLGAWFAILSRYHGRIIYIDGFAGPGRYRDGEVGSPVIALDTAINHRRKLEGELVFWFIDERPDRIEHLKAEIDRLQIPRHFVVKPKCGKFHEELERVLNSLERDQKLMAPTFAFIDPFGFSGVPYNLVRRLLNHERCEAFITFMVDAINRFLEHPDEKIVNHIVELFGTERVVAIIRGSGNGVLKLRQLYQEQLKQLGRFVRFFEMRDRQNQVQYYLFFVTNSELGHIKMKEAMWHIDPEGDFRFSDATNPAQLVIFEADTIPILIRELRGHFEVNIEYSGLVIRTFIENETAYLKKHMTEALSRLESDGIISVNPRKRDNTKRRSGTYPDGALITFS